EGNGSADPEAFALGGRNLVAHPLADDLALELSKGEQHVEGKPAHAGGGVEGLGDRDERHPMFIEQFDQLGEVGERAGETIDLIDHDNRDLAGPDVGEELLQGRAVERGAREPAIIVAIRVEAPALMCLALDVGLAGLALGVKRVELKVEIMLARFAGIDRTALGFWSGRLHFPDSPSPSERCTGVVVPLGRPVATARRDLLLAVWAGVRPLGDRGGASPGSGENVVSLSILRPKKRGPFQFVPVMARAMVERLA